MSSEIDVVRDLLAREQAGILEEWVAQQLPGSRRDLIADADLREQSRRFLQAVAGALGRAAGGDPRTSPEWADARATLGEIVRGRAAAGFAPSETGLFVFSLKRVLVDRLARAEGATARALAGSFMAAGGLLDALGLVAMDEYQKGREEVIRRQQQELLELSTPVVQLWSNVLALPIIGTLDSARTQIVMESLLEEIVRTGSTIAIIDITGVPTVDTLVAQHLLKTVAAARLMGAECIISGIRPQIAQTIVHLGVDLGDVTTKANLADAFAIALRRNGLAVTRSAAA